ncbi:MAG: peptidase [Veillonella sp.]|uniref:peptidase n=1 Tax=Veillonella sp. TaxID=1926307 RepID=UPI00290095D0|nr:peptidase [Veillonella sp.]MDU2347842.1 peptidase [Veillonella sp.]
MNKKLLSLVMTGVLAVGVFSVATPYEAQARKTKPETSTDITIKRAPGQSVVMTMSEIGTIFQNRFPNAALHSVAYKVTGYSKYHEYKMKIDIITGNQSDMSEGGKPKRVIGEIFNKDKVIEPSQAEAAAKAQLGADAVMKGWKVEAHNGKVNYYVTMHQNGKKTVVTVDGNTGAYIEQSKATKLPPEPDQGFDKRRTNLVWGHDIVMDKK